MTDLSVQSVVIASNLMLFMSLKYADLRVLIQNSAYNNLYSCVSFIHVCHHLCRQFCPYFSGSGEGR